MNVGAPYETPTAVVHDLRPFPMHQPDGEVGREVIDVTLSEVEVVELTPQLAAVVTGHVTLPEIPTFVGSAFGEVMQALDRQGLAVAGPPFGRYVPAGDGFDVEVGFPATGEVTPTEHVVGCELPGGQAARVLYQGAYGGVAQAYNATSEWIAQHGYVASGPLGSLTSTGPMSPSHARSSAFPVVRIDLDRTRVDASSSRRARLSRRASVRSGA